MIFPRWLSDDPLNAAELELKHNSVDPQGSECVTSHSELFLFAVVITLSLRNRDLHVKLFRRAIGLDLASQQGLRP